LCYQQHLAVKWIHILNFTKLAQILGGMRRISAGKMVIIGGMRKTSAGKLNINIGIPSTGGMVTIGGTDNIGGMVISGKIQELNCGIIISGGTQDSKM